MIENTIHHSTTINHDFTDAESGNSLELRIVGDEVVGIILNGNEDEGLYLTVDQVRPVAKVLQSIVDDADARAMLDRLQEEVDAIRETADAVISGLDQPQSRKPPYSDPSEASEHDMADWNYNALLHAEGFGSDVTFTYQGEHDPYPRQRVVGNVFVEDGRVYVYDREDDDAYKNFRLDRIKSHVLVLDG